MEEAVHHFLDDIRDGIDGLDDPILERVLALLTQASVGIRATKPTLTPDDSLKELKKDHFLLHRRTKRNFGLRKLQGILAGKGNTSL